MAKSKASSSRRCTEPERAARTLLPGSVMTSTLTRGLLIASLMNLAMSAGVEGMRPLEVIVVENELIALPPVLPPADAEGEAGVLCAPTPLPTAASEQRLKA